MVAEEAYQKACPSPPHPLAGRLLSHAATGAALGTAWCDEADPDPFRRILEGGLGALLHHACRDDLGRVPPSWRATLQSAELTARIVHAGRVETMLEILDACDAVQVPAVLDRSVAALFAAWRMSPECSARAAVASFVKRSSCSSKKREPGSSAVAKWVQSAARSRSG